MQWANLQQIFSIWIFLPEVERRAKLRPKTAISTARKNGAMSGYRTQKVRGQLGWPTSRPRTGIYFTLAKIWTRWLELLTRLWSKSLFLSSALRWLDVARAKVSRCARALIRTPLLASRWLAHCRTSLRDGGSRFGVHSHRRAISLAPLRCAIARSWARLESHAQDSMAGLALWKMRKWIWENWLWEFMMRAVSSHKILDNFCASHFHVQLTCCSGHPRTRPDAAQTGGWSRTGSWSPPHGSGVGDLAAMWCHRGADPELAAAKLAGRHQKELIRCRIASVIRRTGLLIQNFYDACAAGYLNFNYLFPFSLLSTRAHSKKNITVMIQHNKISYSFHEPGIFFYFWCKLSKVQTTKKKPRNWLKKIYLPTKPNRFPVKVEWKNNSSTAVE